MTFFPGNTSIQVNSFELTENKNPFFGQTASPHTRESIAHTARCPTPHSICQSKANVHATPTQGPVPDQANDPRMSGMLGAAGEGGNDDDKRQHQRPLEINAVEVKSEARGVVIKSEPLLEINAVGVKSEAKGVAIKSEQERETPKDGKKAPRKKSTELGKLIAFDVRYGTSSHGDESSTATPGSSSSAGGKPKRKRVLTESYTVTDPDKDRREMLYGFDDTTGRCNYERFIPSGIDTKERDEVGAKPCFSQRECKKVSQGCDRSRDREVKRAKRAERSPSPSSPSSSAPPSSSDKEERTTTPCDYEKLTDMAGKVLEPPRFKKQQVSRFEGDPKSPSSSSSFSTTRAFAVRSAPPTRGVKKGSGDRDLASADSRLRDELAKMESELGGLRGERDSARDERDSARGELASLRVEMNANGVSETARGRISSSSHSDSEEVLGLKRENAALNRRLTTALQLNTERGTTIKNQKKEIDEITAKLDVYRKGGDKPKTGVFDDLDENGPKTEEGRQRVISWKTRLYQLEKELTAEKKKVEVRDNEITRLRDEIKRKPLALPQAIATPVSRGMSAADRKTLEEDLQRRRAEVSRVSAENTKARGELEHMKLENERLDADVKRIRDERVGLKQRIETLGSDTNEQIHWLNVEIENLEIKINHLERRRDAFRPNTMPYHSNVFTSGHNTINPRMAYQQQKQPKEDEMYDPAFPTVTSSTGGSNASTQVYVMNQLPATPAAPVQQQQPLYFAQQQRQGDVYSDLCKLIQLGQQVGASKDEKQKPADPRLVAKGAGGEAGSIPPGSTYYGRWTDRTHYV